MLTFCGGVGQVLYMGGLRRMDLAGFMGMDRHFVTLPNYWLLIVLVLNTVYFLVDEVGDGLTCVARAIVAYLDGKLMQLFLLHISFSQGKLLDNSLRCFPLICFFTALMGAD